MTSLFAFAVGIGTRSQRGDLIDCYYPAPLKTPDAETRAAIVSRFGSGVSTASPRDVADFADSLADGTVQQSLRRLADADTPLTAVRLDRDEPIDSTAAAYLKLREGPMTGATIQRNILYQPGTTAEFYDQGNTRRIGAAWAKEADTDFNLYYCAGDPELSRAVLKKARREGIDAHSVVADPLFIDPANGDFRLQPESPALKLGFTPIDMSQIGLRD